jgi:hypothetical protein
MASYKEYDAVWKDNIKKGRREVKTMSDLTRNSDYPVLEYLHFITGEILFRNTHRRTKEWKSGQINN